MVGTVARRVGRFVIVTMLVVTTIFAVILAMLTGCGVRIVIAVMERQPIGTKDHDQAEVEEQGNGDANDGWFVVRSV